MDKKDFLLGILLRLTIFLFFLQIVKRKMIIIYHIWKESAVILTQ